MKFIILFLMVFLIVGDTYARGFRIRRNKVLDRKVEESLFGAERNQIAPRRLKMHLMGRYRLSIRDFREYTRALEANSNEYNAFKDLFTESFTRGNAVAGESRALQKLVKVLVLSKSGTNSGILSPRRLIEIMNGMNQREMNLLARKLERSYIESGRTADSQRNFEGFLETLRPAERQAIERACR